MGKTKKLIELDNKAIEILEKQAKLQKRSLKNYLEFMSEDKALYLSEPSEEYKAMIDAALGKMERGEMKMYSHKELMESLGRKV